jgi:ankyrin repeat domain-containing protein 13
VFDFSSDAEDDEEDKYKIKIRDTSVWEVNFSEEDLGTPKAGSSPQKEQWDLPKFVFKCDLESIMDHYEIGHITERDLERPDHRGNSPLHLAAKLSKKDEEYLPIVSYLLKIGSNFKAKDGNGWTIIDESITNLNIRLLSLIFDHCWEQKKIKWKNESRKMITKLNNIPDFYMELDWQFNSSVIPFLAKFAPKDTYQIWKMGSNLRLDFSLVGFEKLKGKRRDMSIIFRDGSAAKDSYKEWYLLLLNRSKGIVVDPLEDLDSEEQIAVLQDIWNSESIKADINLSDPTLKQWTTLFGNPKTSKINSFKCTEYKLTIEENKTIEKKGVDIFEWTEEEYFNATVTQEDHEARILRNNPQQLKKDGVVKSKVNKRSAYLWLSDEFELKPKEFFTILDTLQHGGSVGMQRMNNLLQHENLQKVFEESGFPVKIEIPIGFTVNAKVSFKNFTYLNNQRRIYDNILPDDADDLEEIFLIPDTLEKVSRKEGMKTMKNKKKRLAFANFNCS